MSGRRAKRNEDRGWARTRSPTPTPHHERREGDDRERDIDIGVGVIICGGRSDAGGHHHRESIRRHTAPDHRPDPYRGVPVIPQAAMVDSPGSSRIKPSPVRNALGAHVTGATPSRSGNAGRLGVGGVELDEGIVLVGPDRGLPPIRTGQPDPGEPVGVPGQPVYVKSTSWVPIGRSTRKSRSDPWTSTFPVGRPRSSVGRYRSASSCSRHGSIFSVPTVRWGCWPDPYGQVFSPMLVALVRTASPAALSR